MPIYFYKKNCTTGYTIKHFGQLIILLLAGISWCASARDPFESSLTGDYCDGVLVTALSTNKNNAKAIAGPSPSPIPLTGETVDLPAEQARRLLQVSTAGKVVSPTLFTVHDDPPEDAIFTAHYSYPAGYELQLVASIIPTLNNDHTLATRITHCKQPVANGFSVLFAGRETLSFAATAKEQSLLSVGKAFFQQGFLHLIGGIDHLIFLLAIILLCNRWQQAALAVSAFTVAHSITLSTSVLGWQANPVWVEPVISVSILVMGLEVVVRGWRIHTGRAVQTARTLSPAFSLQLAVIFLFGLVHGLGFSNAFQSLRSGQQSDWLVALASFNLAIEVAQLLVAAVFLPLTLWLRRSTINVAAYWVSGSAIAISGLVFLALALTG